MKQEKKACEAIKIKLEEDDAFMKSFTKGREQAYREAISNMFKEQEIWANKPIPEGETPPWIKRDPITVTGSDKALWAMSPKDYPHYKHLPNLDSDEWAIQDFNEGLEISVVRNSFAHGRVSHGWYGEDKILIANRPPAEHMADFMELARKICDKLNLKPEA